MLAVAFQEISLVRLAIDHTQQRGREPFLALEASQVLLEFALFFVLHLDQIIIRQFIFTHNVVTAIAIENDQIFVLRRTKLVSRLDFFRMEGARSKSTVWTETLGLAK